MTYDDLARKHPITHVNVEIYDEEIEHHCGIIAGLVDDSPNEPLERCWPFLLYVYKLIRKYHKDMIDEFANWQQEASYHIRHAIYDDSGNDVVGNVDQGPGEWACLLFLAWIENRIVSTRPPQRRLIPGSPSAASPPQSLRWNPELPRDMPVPPPAVGPAYQTMFFKPSSELTYELKNNLRLPETDFQRKYVIDQAIAAWRDMHREGVERGDVAFPAAPEENPTPADVQPKTRLNLDQYLDLFQQEQASLSLLAMSRST
ncbi:hypothetical protein F4820DRAFT_467861 [Hypoxylon rubiginosum]|uniref:Uncharacterized protein n=1 Tax=Hypoxylon rubiginosum TaxID=110542 RepID=A0ACB9Z843_9PEZI|nr:hypothetical protein F4820DRAFT_467861 [Hypoxylon rubiginosum]